MGGGAARAPVKGGAQRNAVAAQPKVCDGRFVLCDFTVGHWVRVRPAGAKRPGGAPSFSGERRTPPSALGCSKCRYSLRGCARCKARVGAGNHAKAQGQVGAGKDTRTVKQLREELKARGLRASSRRKADLLATLRAAKVEERRAHAKGKGKGSAARAGDVAAERKAKAPAARATKPKARAMPAQDSTASSKTLSRHRKPTLVHTSRSGRSVKPKPRYGDLADSEQYFSGGGGLDRSRRPHLRTGSPLEAALLAARAYKQL